MNTDLNFIGIIGLSFAFTAAFSIALGIAFLFHRDKDKKYSKKMEVVIIAATFVFALATGLFLTLHFLFPNVVLWEILGVIFEMFLVSGILAIVFHKFGIIFPWW